MAKQYIGENFASIKHLLMANERPVNDVFKNHTLESEMPGDGFSGCESYKAAADLLTKGYEEPLEKIKGGVADKVKNFAPAKTSVKTDVIGYAPCVPNAIMGLPNSMLNKDVVTKKSKVISIAYDAGGAWHVDKQQFIDSGIAVLSMINILEMSGYRVSLKIVFLNCSEDKQILVSTVCMKDWRQPLDLKKLAFPICHPAMLRRIGFKHIETIPDLKDSGFTSGYGTEEVSVRKFDGARKLEEELKQAGRIGKDDKYVNLYIAEHFKYDPEAIMGYCGLKC